MILEDLTNRFYLDFPDDGTSEISLLYQQKKDKKLRGSLSRIYEGKQTPDHYYAKTTVNKHGKTYLYSVDKDSFETEIVPLEQEGYVTVFDEDSIWVFRAFSEGMQIIGYDYDFNERISQDFALEGTRLYPQDCITWQGNLWVLTGLVTGEAGEQVTNNALLCFDSSLQLLEQIDLQIPEATACGLEVVDDILYYTITTDGADFTVLPAGSTYLGMYDLQTKVNMPYAIQLELDYPEKLQYVPEHHQLVVLHQYLTPSRNALYRTFIDLDTGAVTSVEFPASLGEGNSCDALFAYDASNYYFLFQHDLVVVNPETFDYEIINLESLGFDGAGAIILPTSSQALNQM